MGRFSSRRGKLYDLNSNRSFTPGTEEYIKVLGMFPEAADVMQTKATMPVDTGSRMAGDEVMNNLDMLLSEIRTSDDDSNRLENLVQEARMYLPQRRQELDALAGGNRVGSRLQDAIEAEAALANLGRLQGNVPMPIIRGGERTHTTYRKDGITGQQLVVPYMKPGSPDTVLRTMMGVSPPKGIDQADEVISARALQLMGSQVSMPQNSKEADFIVIDRNGNKMAIDGMQITQGAPIEMQTHSFVAPTKGYKQTMSVGETQELLDRGYQQGQNVIDQIDNLADRGQMLYPDTAKAAGKILRGDRTQYRVPENMEYDALIMPEYSESIRNGPRYLQPRNIITAPQGIWMADMPAAYDAVRAGQGGKPEVVPNYGGGNNRNGRRQQKAWHKVNVPMNRDTRVDGSPVFIDAVAAEPLVAQLLDEQSMEALRMS